VRKFCYDCGKVATSVEHVLPKCIFPEKKYLPDGVGDLRRNLITVPSCDEHNTAKSKDDEYLGLLLCLSADNNLALKLLSDKWLNELNPECSSLIERFARHVTPIKLPNGQETASLTVDLEVIERSLISMTKALHFYETNGKRIDSGDWWYRSTKLSNHNLTIPSIIPSLIGMRNKMLDLNKIKYPGLELKGENKDAFYYQRLFSNNIKIYRLVFYFSVEFFCVNQNGMVR
jgi:hypothetical protein